MTDFARLLAALCDGNVEFIIVGGLAATIHGSARLTLPFEWSETTVNRGLNFTLTTSAGDIDLLGEITGGGGYDALAPHTVTVELFGRKCRCLDLPWLIWTPSQPPGPNRIALHTDRLR